MTFFLALISILSNLFLTQSEALVKENNFPQANVLRAINQETKNLPKIELDKELSAKAYLVMKENGQVLLAKNEDEPFPIASLTKLFTAYVALKYLPQNAIITFTREAIDQEGSAGSFLVGERFLRDELIKASLVLSSNDAAYALAETYGLANFVFLINRTISSFELHKTHIVEPTGISAGNVSSPRDLLKFVFAFKSEFPQIWQWSLSKSITLDGFTKRTFSNINLNIISKFEKILLLQKTGFTDTAGKCLLAVVKINDQETIGIVILNSPDREKDFETIISALRKYYE